MNSDEQNVANGVFADTSVRSEIVEWKGVEYTFKVRDIPWVEKNRIISKYSSGRKGGKVGVDLGGMHGEMLMSCVVDTGGMFLMNKSNLMKISEDFGNMLVERFIDKVEDDFSEEDLKNLEKPTEDS